MTEPRYQRRKEDRPAEIAAAAFEAFAENGYAATRVEEVAKRAGVSKGLLYLYYKTKEELFKAVVKNVVVRRVDSLVDTITSPDLSTEQFIRGPFLRFMKSIPRSPAPVIIRLLISEGHRHPDLANYYYDNVVSRGLAAIKYFVDRGIERGEIRADAASIQPQLFLSPVMLTVIWNALFAERAIDSDQLIESHMEMLLNHIKA